MMVIQEVSGFVNLSRNTTRLKPLSIHIFLRFWKQRESWE
jgi:hypothetical protein